jgi:hypothetical protein
MAKSIADATDFQQARNLMVGGYFTHRAQPNKVKHSLAQVDAACIDLYGLPVRIPEQPGAKVLS